MKSRISWNLENDFHARYATTRPTFMKKTMYEKWVGKKQSWLKVLEENLLIKLSNVTERFLMYAYIRLEMKNMIYF